MNFYLVILMIILFALFLLIRIIAVVKIKNGDYSSFFVRQLSFFPAEPVNTDHLTESTRRKIIRLAIISGFIDTVGLFFLMWPSPDFFLKYILGALLFGFLPYFFFKKRLYQYLNL